MSAYVGRLLYVLHMQAEVRPQPQQTPIVIAPVPMPLLRSPFWSGRSAYLWD